MVKVNKNGEGVGVYEADDFNEPDKVAEVAEGDEVDARDRRG